MTSPADYLMTVEEVAAEQRLSPETLYTWRSRSLTTGVPIGPRSTKRGRRVVYRRSDVDAWVKAQEDASAVGGAA